MDPCMHAIMELFHHGDELPCAAELGHDPPSTGPHDSVEGLGQIDVGGEQVGMLFLAFLLKLPCSEYDVYFPALFPESTLAPRKESLVEVQCETVVQDPGEYLACDGEE